MLVRYFSLAEVAKRRKYPNELAKIDWDSKAIIPLCRSYEKIGFGIRTQLEFFYPKFQIVFVTACPEQLSPVALMGKSKAIEPSIF